MLLGLQPTLEGNPAMTKCIVKDLCNFVIFAGVLFSAEVSATAIAFSGLIFHDVTITPAAGSVLFTGPWILEAQGSANNSLGQFDDDSDSTTGPGLVIATAAVTWANASSAAADPPPTPPYLDIAAGTLADANIPGQIDASAIALGRGTVRRDDPFLPSFFEITGGTAGDPVSVNFSVLIDYALDVQTDQYGILAEAEAIFGEELFGDDVRMVLVNSFDRLLRIGPDDHQSAGAINLLLSNTLDLHYGTFYSLLLEADAEVRVINAPEPATVWLMILALPLLYRSRRVRIVQN